MIKNTKQTVTLVGRNKGNGWVVKSDTGYLVATSSMSLKAIKAWAKAEGLVLVDARKVISYIF